MNENMNPLTPTSEEAADQNVERLIGRAYTPEHVDEAFRQKMLAKVDELAAERAESAPPRPLPFKRWVGIGAALAAGIAVILGIGALLPEKGPGPDDELKPTKDQLVRITVRPRPAPPKVGRIGIGESLTTKAGERRLVSLPDGSRLFVNEKTQLRVDADRTVKLEKGEVFIEVAPKQGTGATFTVQTARRDLQALGTKFGVRLADRGVAALVTQGKVRVEGLGKVLEAGERLERDRVSASPRASVALDWTRELMALAEPRLVPESEHTGGALIAKDPDGQERRLELRKYHIDVHIEDGFARTTIDQTYFNGHPWRMEGTFLFPLPADASLSRLAMYVAGQKMEGGMVERDRARAIYQKIVDTQKDPALLEWIDGSTFRMRVFPLEARQEKRIVLSYTQKLSDLYGKMSYRFPAGHSLGEVAEWSFQARVKDRADDHVTSPLPLLQWKNDGKDLVLFANEKKHTFDRDVAFSLHEQPRAKEEIQFTSAKLDDWKYLMMRFRPKLEGHWKTEQRDWVILYECSADRDPLLARAQIEIIRHFLAHASHEDTFQILAVNHRVAALTDKPLTVKPETVAEVIQQVEKTHLIGALDLGRAMESAGELAKKVRNPHVLHIGSGLIRLGERDREKIMKHLPEKAKYIGVGVGKRWNRQLMKSSAEETGGFFTQINPDELISWRAFELFSTLSTPRLVDVKVELAGRKKEDKQPFVTFHPYASIIPQGEEIVAMARHDAFHAIAPGKLIVTGKLNGKPYRKEIAIPAKSEEKQYIPRTWARLRIEEMIRDGAEAHKAEIIKLSKEMYVMSPFTSLLVLENEAMYKEHNVDRGRKDHWALYPAPESIPVVHEPLPGQEEKPKPEEADPSKKPSVEQVLQTLAWRGRPRVFGAQEGERKNPADRWKNPADRLEALRADPESNTPRIVDFKVTNGLSPLRLYDRSGRERRFENGELLGKRLVLSNDVTPEGRERRDAIIRGTAAQLGDHFQNELGWGASAPRDLGLDGIEPLQANWFDNKANGNLGSYYFYSRSAATKQRLLKEGGGNDLEGDRMMLAAKLPALREAELRPKSAPPTKRELISGRDAYIRLPEQLLQQQRKELVYTRPQLRESEQLLRDLLLFAPGMNTNMADVYTVLEDEARLPLVPQGRVDPEARKLIESARDSGWQAVTIPDQGLAKGFTIVHDGQSKFRWERRLLSDLREIVVCDGKTLYHLYPEIGVGAKRKVSRFHIEELRDLVPWLVPSVEELARGADVEHVEGGILEVIPHRGKVKSRWVFENGRLIERALLLKEDGKLLASERYQDGIIRLFDEEGKERSKLALKEEKAQSPGMQAPLKGLVVLSLPYRTWEHNKQKHELGDWNNWPRLDEDEALDMLASCVASEDGNFTSRIPTIIAQRFMAQGDARPGFLTLLVAKGHSPEAVGARSTKKQTGEESPLLYYLDHFRALQQEQRANALANASPFLHRMETLYQLVRMANPYGAVYLESHALREAKLKLLRTGRDPRLAWMTLENYALQEKGSEKRTHGGPAFREDVLEAVAKSLEEVAGLSYAARYELACYRFVRGKKAEARKLFRTLFEEVFEGGGVPVVDAYFRQAFEADDSWRAMMKGYAAQLAEKERYADLILLSEMCASVGDVPLSDELLASASFESDPVKHHDELLQVVASLYRHHRYEQAERIVLRMTEHPSLADKPYLWRLAMKLASERGMQSKAMDHLEVALELEAMNPPKLLDLEKWNQEHQQLLSHYETVAGAFQTLQQEAPSSLESRIVRLAERWRARGIGDGELRRIAVVLELLGRDEPAWDYLTTLYAQAEPKHSDWANWASAWQTEHAHELADRAWREAYQLQPENAQYLWNRVQNWRQAGKPSKARPALRMLVEGEWSGGYHTYQRQARRLLGEK